MYECIRAHKKKTLLKTTTRTYTQRSRSTLHSWREKPDARYTSGSDDEETHQPTHPPTHRGRREILERRAQKHTEDFLVGKISTMDRSARKRGAADDERPPPQAPSGSGLKSKLMKMSRDLKHSREEVSAILLPLGVNRLKAQTQPSKNLLLASPHSLGTHTTRQIQSHASFSPFATHSTPNLVVYHTRRPRNQRRITL